VHLNTSILVIQSQYLFVGKDSTLEANLVESIPVKVEKKLSKIRTLSIGYFSLIPNTTACPHCHKTSVGLDIIFKKFGLRNMGDGTTRVQSWCKECRNKSSKRVVV